MIPAAREAEILAKCAGILGVESISGRDDFFGVGGDSLDAAEISEMLTAELGRDVDMETVLRSPTFAAMLSSIGSRSPE
ncbi:phosphopantetheine-binding protein [Streptomyces sp. NBC_00441]|uniref:acyl carrier protein n=1 Tax=Streptomyces sp. NBC_00441 TaxID=2975742 RepID=UPI002E2D7838|nr:acyl carrier protein [Streptomyces sp. NBC_00441]